MDTMTMDPSDQQLVHARSVADLRDDYRVGTLDVADVASDPFSQFDRWFADALSHREKDEPSAMTLATASALGVPSSRTVLLKGFDARGFTWFTNYGSTKGRELTENPFASLCFRWSVFERQVVICGTVSRVDETEAVEYFDSRPRGSRIGAIVSAQSSAIPDRIELEAAAAVLDAGPDSALIKPAHWGGFRLSPVTVEFWQGRSSRLHDRLQFARATTDPGDTAWTVARLAP
jgi:pyridoxamine 5'-phosphate oxidase